jgi:hypothetical protein
MLHETSLSLLIFSLPFLCVTQYLQGRDKVELVVGYQVLPQGCCYVLPFLYPRAAA